MTRPLWRIIRRTFVIAAWAFKSTAMAARDNSATSRLLMIYDFGSQPISVGDILIYQAAAAVLRRTHDVELMDFVLVYEKAQPVIGDPAFSHISPENFSDYLSDIVSVSGMCPDIGSLLILDSHAALERYIEVNSNRYLIWPNASKYAAKEYLYYYIFNELLFTFYSANGFLPELSISPSKYAWAENFTLEHASGYETVSIQLRRNPRDPQRNSDYDAWFEFITEAKSRYPVKFILIGAASELEPRLESHPALIIAKRFGTSITQDLALIKACRFHMGASSGPSVMAFFSKRPYCIFNTDVRSDLLKGTYVEGSRSRFFFATPMQNMISGKETKQQLMSEFERMWNSIFNADPQG